MLGPRPEREEYLYAERMAHKLLFDQTGRYGEQRVCRDSLEDRLSQNSEWSQ